MPILTISKYYQRQASLKEQHLQKIQSHQSKYQTPQRYSNVVPFGKVTHSSNKTNLSSRLDQNEEFRREVVEQVKIRVEELQSKMKSKSDMFYVMRHMCKEHLCLS